MTDVVFKGKYRIVREIARSNDIVYEAIDTSLGRRIALKELNLAQGLTGQARRERIERFTREARAAGRLSHPNIVSIFDFGEDNGRYFISMEFLEGQTLRDRIYAQNALSVREAVDIACQVLDALAFAHANNVIHRDIKPDNIQILPGGQVKLTDFGIARLSEEPSLTVDGQVFGTPSYMAPEQIEGRSIDHRADLFAVGLVLYEMITGRKAFVGDSVISITYAIMNQEPPPMPGVPLGIEQVVRRALSKSPLQRYATADEMKLDLRNAEQTPAMFLPPTNPTGSYGSNTPYYSQPSQQGGYGYAPPPSQPQNAPPQTMMGGVVFTPLPPASNTPPAPFTQPWSWNGAQQGTSQLQNAPPSVMLPPTQIQAGGAGWNPPSPPLFDLSEGVRRFLIAILIAAVCGGAIGFGVVAFLRGYERFQTSANTQLVIEKMNVGKIAYDKKDFEAATKAFEAALSLNRDQNETPRIHYSLTATYIQRGNLEAERKNWAEAQKWFEQATRYAPDSLKDTARKGLAIALEQQGFTQRAAESRELLNGNGEQAPEALPGSSPALGRPTNADVYATFRQQAQQLIAEGDKLLDSGDLSGARDKWTEALGKAAGDTPERTEAKDRLDRTQQSMRF